MKPDIQIINPTEYKGWDDLILSHPDYSFFHSSVWAKVLSESYHYTPLYMTVLNKNKLSALVPMMEVNSFLTKKRGVSLPFTDYCEPMISDGITFQVLLKFILDVGKERGWDYLELRSCKNLSPFPSFAYLGHNLDLTEGAEKAFSGFRDSAKRNIRKSGKVGVKVEMCATIESMKIFYHLNCMTRKRHGFPPQPYGFFRKVYDHIISHHLGFVVLASFQEKPIAGAIYFHFGERAVYKYGASNLHHQELRANNLVMWEAIKWYAQNGYKSFCFGRTEPENQGLIQFKSGWGPIEQQINYYRYDLKRCSFVSGSSKVAGFHNNKMFRNMPIPILKSIGSILYKHAG